MLAGRVLVIGETTYGAAELDIDTDVSVTISGRTGSAGDPAHTHSFSGTGTADVMADVELADGIVYGRVLAEKPTIQFAAASSSAEAGETHTVSVEKTVFAAVPAALTVRYSIGGTATSGTDYTMLSGTVTIPEGDRSANISIVVDR